MIFWLVNVLYFEFCLRNKLKVLNDSNLILNYQGVTQNQFRIIQNLQICPLFLKQLTGSLFHLGSMVRATTCSRYISRFQLTTDQRGDVLHGTPCQNGLVHPLCTWVRAPTYVIGWMHFRLLMVRYLSRFFDNLAHQTTYAYNRNIEYLNGQ